MYCNKCGAKLDDDAKFCNKCGNKIVQNDNVNDEIMDDCTNDNNSNRYDVYIRVIELFDMDEYKNSKAEVIKIIKEEFNISLIEAKSIVDEYNENPNKFKEVHLNNANNTDKSTVNISEVSTDDEIDSIHDSKSEFVFLPNIPKRNLILKILNYVDKGFTIIVGILILIFIKEQIDAGENLKFIIYIIRFITTFFVLFFWGEVINETKELLNLKYVDIKNNTKKENVITISVIKIICLAITNYYFVSPSDKVVWELGLAIVNESFIESFIDTIFAYKIPVLFWILTFVVDRVKYKRFIVEKEDVK